MESDDLVPHDSRAAPGHPVVGVRRRWASFVRGIPFEKNSDRRRR